MLKLLDFESFLNESEGGIKILPSLNPNLVSSIGGSPSETEPEKTYVSCTDGEIKISKLFRSPQKSVSVIFNSDKNKLEDRNGMSVYGGVYIHSINIPPTSMSDLDHFICKSPEECSEMSYKILVEMGSALGILNDLSLMSALVKSLGNIQRDYEARTYLADVNSFKSFLMGLRNTYDIAAVKKSLGSFNIPGSLVKPEVLLDVVKKGLI